MLLTFGTGLNLNKNMDFYDTAQETGEDLKEAQAKAAIQEKKVHDLFISNPYINFTSDEVHNSMVDFEFKTSTRRCISNLKTKGFVIDTGERRKGDSGRKQIVWRTVDEVIDVVDLQLNKRIKYLKDLESLKSRYENHMSVYMMSAIDLELE